MTSVKEWTGHALHGGRPEIPSAGLACRCVDRRGHARGDGIARATRRAAIKRTPADAARSAGRDATGAAQS
ncbi:hypothetical protein, partial [Burkholderia territorii]|uniref:hypothetical protein n=1 Tax=Burkholderia territorii TaxID=1503055 RepID=UPI001BA75DDA